MACIQRRFGGEDSAGRERKLAGHASDLIRWMNRDLWKPILETELALDESTVYGFDAKNLGAEAVLDFVHEHALPLVAPANDYGLAIVRSQKARLEAATKMAANILTVDAAKIVFERRVRQIARQIAGHDPVHDDAGNVLSGDDAQTKRLALYEHWDCFIVASDVQFGKPQNQRLSEQAVAWLVEERNRPFTLPEARDIYLERFDDAVRDRCVFLFDAPDAAPHNEPQATARYAMLGYRRGLKRALAVATSADACKTAADTAIASVQSTSVDRSPLWFHGSSTVSSGAVSDTYTRGSGASKWSLALAARTTGVEPDQHGQVDLDPLPESDEFDFTVSRQASSAVTVTISRKSGATGHPPAAVYPFTFVARNDRGATALTVTINVSDGDGNGD